MINRPKPFNERNANRTFLICVVLAFILICSVANAQSNFRINKVDSFNFAVVIDPSASLKENGLCIGAEIEYLGTVYTRASATYFGALNVSYLDFIGAVGINFTSGYFEQFRYYGGLRAGIISRSGNGYATAGIECGIDYVFSEKWILGLRATRDKRGDFAFYNEPSEMRNSGFVKFGFKF